MRSVVYFSPRYSRIIFEKERMVKIEQFSGLASPEMSISETIRRDKMLFSFKDVELAFSEIISRWFALYDQVEPALDIYFSTHYHKNSILTPEFLQPAQALETYHRRIIGGQLLTDEMADEARSALKNAIPVRFSADQKDSLEQKLRYIHEFSLRHRLRDLYRKAQGVCGIEVQKHLGNREDFVNTVVDTRNYYTHYDETLLLKAKTGMGLYLLKRRCLFLLEVLLMVELGFSSETMTRIFEETNAYEFLLDYRSLNRSVPGEIW